MYPGSKAATRIGLSSMPMRTRIHRPGVEAVLRSYDPAALCLYPDANARLLKASIARHYGVAPEQVFVGNGSDDVLALAFQSF